MRREWGWGRMVQLQDPYKSESRAFKHIYVRGLISLAYPLWHETTLTYCSLAIDSRSKLTMTIPECSV